MSDKFDKKSAPDPENPPFDFSAARSRRNGDPVSSEAARLRRALREVSAAGTIEDAHDIALRARQE